MSYPVGHSIERYHILEKLGQGGMAIVYKAYDTRLETDVAVKLIRTENILPSVLGRALKRFEREAKALARLTHPNIVKVTDYGEHEENPYLVMTYLPGGTLKQKMGKPIPWQDAVQLLLPIAEALDYAHSQDMIHRDVKPSNILLTERGQPMLTDFGIAKVLDLEETLDLTGTNAAVGTPEYMAPEQATAKMVDHRVDIYALGIVLYEMITGKKPYMADTPMAILIMHARDPLPSPKKFVPGLPDGVVKVLLKALAKRPEDRYQSMGELMGGLNSLLTSSKQYLNNPRSPTIGDTKTLETAVNIQQAEPNQSGSRSNVRATYWVIAVIILVFGIGLITLTPWRGRQSHVPIPIAQVTDTIVPYTPTLSPTVAGPAIGETPVLPLTSTPAHWFDGTLIYKAKGKSGLEDFYLFELATGRKVQLANNQGFSIDHEKISDDGRFLAFRFSYGDSDDYKLGIVALDVTEVVQITNDLRIANTGQYDWLPDNRVLFINTSQILIYDPAEENTSILAPGDWYSLSPDRESIVIVDSQAKNVAIGTLTGVNRELSAVEGGEQLAADLMRTQEIIWAPDGKKFAVVTGNYYRQEKMHLSIWPNSGVQDTAPSVESADWISFSWGESSNDYAYVAGTLAGEKLKNTLHLASESIELESPYEVYLNILPDNNLVYGNWGYASYLVDRESLTIEKIQGEPFYVRSVNKSVTILNQAYSEDNHFMLADRNGLRDLEFVPVDVWSWNLLETVNGFWLTSGNRALALNTGESESFDLPDGSTIIAWVHTSPTTSFDELPTLSVSSQLDFFTCEAREIRENKKYIVRRTCSCTETECNCIDYLWGSTSTSWTRPRGGIEDYFSKLGGSCYSP